MKKNLSIERKKSIHEQGVSLLADGYLIHLIEQVDNLTETAVPVGNEMELIVQDFLVF